MARSHHSNIKKDTICAGACASTLNGKIIAQGHDTCGAPSSRPTRLEANRARRRADRKVIAEQND